jgi:elongation factor Ts
MSMDAIKKLRDITSLGVGDCKNALAEAKGDFDKALEVLKKRGADMMAKRKDRKISQGLVESYIHHGGNLGVLVEVNCETDFVARTDNFKKFVRDIAMHIAAVSPAYVKREDIPQSEIAKIGNIDEFAKQYCLLEQAYVKDSKITVGDYLKSIISQTGENVGIRRFARFGLGEEA